MTHSFRHTLDIRVDDVEDKNADDPATDNLSPSVWFPPRKKRWIKDGRRQRREAREAKSWHDTD